MPHLTSNKRFEYPSYSYWNKSLDSVSLPVTVHSYASAIFNIWDTVNHEPRLFLFIPKLIAPSEWGRVIDFASSMDGQLLIPIRPDGKSILRASETSPVFSIHETNLKEWAIHWCITFGKAPTNNNMQYHLLHPRGASKWGLRSLNRFKLKPPDHVIERYAALGWLG